MVENLQSVGSINRNLSVCCLVLGKLQVWALFAVGKTQPFTLCPHLIRLELTSMAKPKPNDGEKDDQYTRQQSTLLALGGVGSLLAGVQGSILNLTLGLGQSKLRTVSMSFAIVALINSIFTSLYSTVMHVLHRKTPDEEAKGHGSVDDAAKERPKDAVGSAEDGHAHKSSCTLNLWVYNPKYVDDMIKWCGTFLVIGE